MNYNYDFVREQINAGINEALYYELHSLCEYFHIDNIDFCYPFDGDAGTACADLVDAWTGAVMLALEENTQ